MPVNNNQNQFLTGEAAALAGQPLAQTPKGGVETGFDGSSGMTTQPQSVNGEGQPDQFQGMGPLLEEDDPTVFQTVHNLVLRQELIARNHLALDTHYTRVKTGYPFSKLEKIPDQDIYRASLPFGVSAISTQAVPNKTWDLVNKCAETLLVDFPQADPSPLNDSEEAERAAEMAERFLTQDAGENGTNDSVLFYQALDKALTCSSSYLHAWVDPVGGGYVPLQIKAHPQAVSPDDPMVGPDGMPTTDYILRYVTAPEGGQFTDDPSQAAPQWLPKIKGEVWGREHVRVFPETADVAGAEKLVIIYYCTLGEAKRRWESVAAMTPDQLSALCDWTPLRYLTLLPPFERARWKITTGSDKERSGSSDERIMFYYLVYQKPTPEYPKGGSIVVTGANDGLVIDKKLLAATVEVPGEDGQGPKKDVRCMDIPVVQLRPRLDADDRDPTGRAYIELFSGAAEFNAALASAYLEAMDIILHVEKYIPATSPVEGWQIDNARATGDAITILDANDKPTYGQIPPIPNNFLEVMEWGTGLVDSIASLNKPVTGANDQQEVSGRARAIAVQQSMIGLNRMQAALMAAYERWCRIKIQLAMRDFSAPQQIRYVGEDGAYKQEQWTGVDFALVGDVGIQAGTGTMRSPESKVAYIASLLQLGLLSPGDAADAARPTFADALGLPENAHEQYIERCIASWMDGPPAGNPEQGQPDWLALNQQYQQAMQQYQQEAQQMQMAAQEAQIKAQATGMQAPQVQMPPQPTPPWNPFAPRPNDDEPEVALLWAHRLSKVISSVKYAQMDPNWSNLLAQKYLAARVAATPPPQLPKGVNITMPGDASTVGSEIKAASNPNAPPPPEPQQAKQAATPVHQHPAPFHQNPQGVAA